MTIDMTTTRLALVLAAAASPAFAEPAHEISITETTRALRTSSANAVTDKSLVGGVLGYAQALPLALPYGLSLAGEGSFAWGSAEGSMFQTLSTEVDTLGFSAAARLRYPVLNRVNAMAGLGLGLQRAALTIRDDTHTTRDHGWGVISQVSLGLEFLLVHREGFTLGLRGELGYVGAAPVSLAAMSVQSDDTIHLMATNASLGTLNLSGPLFAMSLVGAF